MYYLLCIIIERRISPRARTRVTVHTRLRAAAAEGVVAFYAAATKKSVGLRVQCDTRSRRNESGDTPSYGPVTRRYNVCPLFFVFPARLACEGTVLTDPRTGSDRPKKIRVGTKYECSGRITSDGFGRTPPTTDETKHLFCFFGTIWPGSYCKLRTPGA